jgi:magnesium chelatase subunit D
VLPAETVGDRVVGTLSCAAFDHRLGGVLLLDLRPDLIDRLAAWLAAAIGGPARVVTLGADDSDDTLWVTADAGFAPAPGRLQESPDTTLVVVVPDLSRANLAVTRAATVLIGADGAVADRHGRHAAWRPRARWLAACPAADAERLSPHLLDRFPVRVAAAGFGTPARTPADLLAALDRDTTATMPGLPVPSPLTGPLPAMSAEVATIVTSVIGAAAAPHRRDLALARAARAVAVSDRAAVIEARHVHRAAELLGFRSTAPALADPIPPGPSSPGPASPGPASPGPASPGPAVSGDDTGAPVPHADAAVEVAAPAGPPMQPAPTSVLPPGPAPLAGPPLYPEDGPDALPDFASLRLPWQRAGGRRATRGPIVGTEPSGRPVDIAYLATVLEAAKYRRIRHGAGAPLRIHASDLRSYRRQPQPDAALVLLLDHTSKRDWDVTAALAPYLGWAYTRRAAVSLVEIGHRDAASELQAERRRLSGVLDPLLNAALDRTPARATPLAHGLDLALQEMRLRRRTLPIRAGEAWFVVVSDGRGNIPLEASQRNVVPRSVSRAGVDDALTVASGVAGLRAVRAVVLAPPELSHYRDLPFALADAMAGIVARPDGAP